MTSIRIKDLKKLTKTKEYKESLEANKRILCRLKILFGRRLTIKQYKKVMWSIPDYNPKNENDAVSIGKWLIIKQYKKIKLK